MDADKLSYPPCESGIMRSIIFFIIKLKCNYGKYPDYFIKHQKELQAAQKENLFGRNCPEVAHGHSSRERQHSRATFVTNRGTPHLRVQSSCSPASVVLASAA